MAYSLMRSFEEQCVLSVGEQNGKDDLKVGNTGDKPVYCLRHKTEPVEYFCITCNGPICKECTILEHPSRNHNYEHLNKAGPKQMELMVQAMQEVKSKANDFRTSLKNIKHNASRLEVQYHKAQTKIDETTQFFHSELDKLKQEMWNEMEILFTAKQMAFDTQSQKTLDYDEYLRKHPTEAEVQPVHDTTSVAFQTLDCELKLVSNYEAIQAGIRNVFGCVRSSSKVPDGPSKHPPIARPVNGSSLLNGSALNGTASLNGLMYGHNSYKNWSNGGSDGIYQNGGSDHFNGHGDSSAMSLMHVAERQKMFYHRKFGGFGALEGQFSEPKGVAVNAQYDIIVADTNNHRIQIFDKEGRFKFQFGECGNQDGQLLFPNRVAVVRTSGDIIVTERSPVHQIQIYNKYGRFMCKFGANILQHPRGVTVDNKGRIIVVECKVMKVTIFDQSGKMLQKFGCSQCLRFPNGVVVNDKQEIFISDNRVHCVMVFNYDGIYLRQIGREGLTDFPIGVSINSAGEILIVGNHKGFCLTIFKQDGELVSAIESIVTHAQCNDVTLVDDGSVVLASKDNRLYIYRYDQVLPC